MALQGTLETFALPDVLRLLASTKKSGVLRVDTERGHGEVVVVDGALAGGSAERAPLAEDPADVLFELLRSADGSFLFDTDADVTGTGARADVETALTAAEAQLAEWREIEAVVPSPRRPVALVAERDGDITLTAAQWRAVAAIGAGCTVEELGLRLGLTELPAARLVRDLLEVGAVGLGDSDVADADPATAALVDDRTADEPVAAVEAPPAAPAPVEAVAPPVAVLPPLPGVDDLTGPEPAVPASESAVPEAPEPLAPVAPLFASSQTPEAPPAEPPPAAPTWEPEPAFAPSSSSSFFDDDDEDPLADDPFGPDPFRIPRLPGAGAPEAQDSDAAEMARQLANLSPRAAQAVAAAAAATSDEERDQALAQVAEESDEPVNRGLLLKFLSSVDE